MPHLAGAYGDGFFKEGLEKFIFLDGEKGVRYSLRGLHREF